MYKILLSIILFFLFCKNTHALTLSPSTVNIETIGGVPKNISFTVYNETSQSLNIKSYVWDLIIDKDGRKNIVKPNINNKNSISPYIQVQQNDFIIKAKERKKVDAIINIPDKIKGGNIGLVLFEASPILKNGQSLVSISTRLGATVIQETKGTIKEKSRITELNFNKESESAPLNFRMNVLNEGNNFTKSSIMIGVLGEDDTFYGSYSTDKRLVSPNSNAIFEKEIPLNLKKGNYNSVITYTYNKKTITINKPFQIK
ncbi:MAG: hypothetical protein U0354_17415 [Candidatus Sericytochromatia bacterium]